MTSIDTLLIAFPVLILLIIISTLIYSEGKSIPFFTKGLGLIILITTSILLAYSTGGPDKGGYGLRYVNAEDLYFFNGSYNFSTGGRNEFLWAYYALYVGKLFNNNIELCHLFTAFIYCISYYLFAIKMFPSKFCGYIVLMAIGCLGFESYGNNVIRSGLSLSFILLAFSLKNKLVKLLLCYIAINFHKSGAIPIGAFLFASYYKKFNYEKIWIYCLILSIINLDLSPIFETIGFIDNRIDSYIINTESNSRFYHAGFRIDFIIYSLAPILITKYTIKNLRIKDTTYLTVYNSYLIVNSFWLLVIRAPFTDRFAYLSWFMIPYLTLFPYLKMKEFQKNPVTICFILIIFIGINFILNLR